MKTLEEIKKKFEDRFKVNLNGDISEEHIRFPALIVWQFIESTISQTKQELIEEIKKEFENTASFENGVSSYGWYTIYKDEFEELLEKISNK